MNDKIEIPIEVVDQIIKYCEDKQICDDLIDYNDFYYRLKLLRI